MNLAAKWKLPLVVLVGTVLLLGGAALTVRLLGGHLVNIQDNSMAPVLKQGDLAIATNVPASQIKEDDIVATADPKDTKKVIAHRVVGTPEALGPNNFQTMGDNNPSPEAFVTADKVMGKINYRIPYAGALVNGMSWVATGIVLAVAAAIGGAIYEYRLKLRHRREEEQPYVLLGYDPRQHFPHHFGHN